MFSFADLINFNIRVIKFSTVFVILDILRMIPQTIILETFQSSRSSIFAIFINGVWAETVMYR